MIVCGTSAAISAMDNTSVLRQEGRRSLAGCALHESAVAPAPIGGRVVTAFAMEPVWSYHFLNYRALVAKSSETRRPRDEDCQDAGVVRAAL